jgi:hypothetical protein
MKKLWALNLLGGIVCFATTASSEELAWSQRRVQIAQTVCEQVISCGTKDGKRKEYPTPCAARDDGATNITPKTGPTCEIATK